MKTQIKHFLLLVVLGGLSETSFVVAMQQEAKARSYQVATKGNNCLPISRELFLASPRLQALEQENPSILPLDDDDSDNEVDLSDLKEVEEMDVLLRTPPAERKVFFANLKSEKLRDCFGLMSYLGLRDLLDEAILAKRDLYTKLLNRSTENPIPTLAQLTISTVSIPQRASSMQDRLRGSRKAIMKELLLLNEQDATTRLELLRWFLRSDKSKLMGRARLKLGWLLAINEPSATIREAIFEELAYVLHAYGGAIDWYDTFPSCFTVNISCLEDRIFDYKIRIKLLYNLLQRLKKERMTPGEILSIQRADGDIKETFSPALIIDRIDSFRRELAVKRAAPFKSSDKLIRSLFNLVILLSDGQLPAIIQKANKIKGPIFEDLPALVDFFNFSGVSVSTVFTPANSSNKPNFLHGAFLYDTVKRNAKDVSTCSSALLNCLRAGTSVTAPDTECNTFVHQALLHEDEAAIRALTLLVQKGDLDGVMDLENNEQFSPRMLLQRIPLTEKNFEYLLEFAHKTGAEFSREQLANVGPLVVKLYRKRLDNQKMRWTDLDTVLDLVPQDIIKCRTQKGKVRFRAVAWALESYDSPFGAEARVYIGWLLTLDESKQDRIDVTLAVLTDLLGTYAKNAPLVEQAQTTKKLPQLLFCPLEKLKVLNKAIKDVQNGAIILPDLLAQINQPKQWIELLQFSECFAQALTRLTPDKALDSKLLKIAYATQDEDTLIDDCCRCILQGAAINARDEKTGNTVAHILIERRKFKALKIFVELFKDHVDLRIQNLNLQTPMHLAALCDTPEFLAFLLDAVPRENLALLATDKKGYRALHYVLIKGWGESRTARILYKKGRRVDCSCGEPICCLELKKDKAYAQQNVAERPRMKIIRPFNVLREYQW